MGDNSISATLLEASKGLMLDGESFQLVGFNAKGTLSNLKFGTKRGDDKIGTVMFTIDEVDDKDNVIGAKRKWAYACFLEPVCKKTGGVYTYHGAAVRIVNGEISKLAAS